MHALKLILQNVKLRNTITILINVKNSCLKVNPNFEFSNSLIGTNDKYLHNHKKQ